MCDGNFSQIRHIWSHGRACLLETLTIPRPDMAWRVPKQTCVSFENFGTSNFGIIPHKGHSAQQFGFLFGSCTFSKFFFGIASKILTFQKRCKITAFFLYIQIKSHFLNEHCNFVIFIKQRRLTSKNCVHVRHSGHTRRLDHGACVWSSVLTQEDTRFLFFRFCSVDAVHWAVRRFRVFRLRRIRAGFRFGINPRKSRIRRSKKAWFCTFPLRRSCSFIHSSARS